VHTDTPYHHGGTLVNATADVIANRVLPDINAKFDNLDNVVRANGNQFPIDGPRFVKAYENELGPVRLPYLRNTPFNQSLNALRSGEPISAGDILHLRNAASNLAAHPDGNISPIGGIFLRHIDNAPLASDTSNIVRDAWQSAIGAARDEFAFQRANPWYRAVRSAVNVGEDGQPVIDSGALDRLQNNFVQNHVTGSNAAPSTVTSMYNFFRAHGNEEAQRTLGVALTDELQNAAKINKNGNGDLVGNFNQNGYNQRLRHLDPKIDAVLSPHDAEQVRLLGTNAQRVKFQDQSAPFNNSGTTRSLLQLSQPDQGLAAAGEAAKNEAISNALDVGSSLLGPKGAAARFASKIGTAWLKGQAEQKNAAQQAFELSEKHRVATEPLAGVFDTPQK
jgi:hypothetical protein